MGFSSCLANSSVWLCMWLRGRAVLRGWSSFRILVRRSRLFGEGLRGRLVWRRGSDRLWLRLCLFRLLRERRWVVVVLLFSRVPRSWSCLSWCLGAVCRTKSSLGCWSMFAGRFSRREGRGRLFVCGVAGVVGHIVWCERWRFCAVRVIGTVRLLCTRGLCLAVLRRGGLSSLGRFGLDGCRGWIRASRVSLCVWFVCFGK